MWCWFIQQFIFGVLFGVAFPVLMLGVLKLIIEVRSDGLYVRLFPFHIQYKQYLFKGVSNYETLTYSPLKRF